LYCIALYCNVMQCNVLYCICLYYCFAMYLIVWSILHFITLCNILLVVCSSVIVLYCIDGIVNVQYSIVLYYYHFIRMIDLHCIVLYCNCIALQL